MQQQHQRGAKKHPARPSDARGGLFDRMEANLAATPRMLSQTDDEVRLDFHRAVAALQAQTAEKSAAAGPAGARPVHGTGGGNGPHPAKPEHSGKKGHSNRWPDPVAGAWPVHGTGGLFNRLSADCPSYARGGLFDRMQADLAAMPRMLSRTDEETLLDFHTKVAHATELRQKLEIAALASVAATHEKDMNQRDALLADAHVAFDLDRTQRDAAHGVDLAQRDAALANAQARHQKELADSSAAATTTHTAQMDAIRLTVQNLERERLQLTLQVQAYVAAAAAGGAAGGAAGAGAGVYPGILLAQPNTWQDPDAGKFTTDTAKRVRLDPNNADQKIEMDSVRNEINLTLNGPAMNITEVYRVENRMLWDSYSLHKWHMSQDPTLSAQDRLEIRCYHGTKQVRDTPGRGVGNVNICDEIVRFGFSLALSGTSVGNLYGRGINVSTTSEYSVQPLYCIPDTNGVKTLFVCLAMPGSSGTRSGRNTDHNGHYKEWNGGVSLADYRRDITNNARYHSTCNMDGSGTKSNIRVLYDKYQVYPQYIVEFT